MRILKLVLLVVGIILIGFGLYNAFIPQEVLSVGTFEISTKNGLNNQTLGMIGLGVLSLLAAIFAQKRN